MMKFHFLLIVLIASHAHAQRSYQFQDVIIQPNSAIVVTGTKDTPSQKVIITNRYTATGVLDPAFNVTGAQETVIGNNAQGLGAVLQADNKIIITGATVNNNASSIALVRFNTDGSLDNTFGTNGIAIFTHGSGVLGRQSIITGTTIVTAGEVVLQGKRTPLVLRVTSTGSLDGTFGTGGIVTTPFTPSANFTSIAEQSTGRLVAGGMAHPNQWIFVRYTTDGSIDTTFGSSGVQVITLGRGAHLSRLILDGDDIIACGNALSNITLVKLNSDGSIDSSFGNNGVVRTILGSRSIAQDIVLESPSSSLVVTGLNGQESVVLKYFSDGTLDTSFGNQGVKTLPSIFGIHNSVDLGALNRITIAGNDDSLAMVAAISSTGVIDTSFGTDGIAHFPPQTPVLGNNYLAAYSTNTQAVTINFTPLSFNLIGPIDGWEHATSGGTTFTCKKGGIYGIRFGSTYSGLGLAALRTLSLHATLNGMELLGSQISTTIDVLQPRVVLATSCIAQLAFDDQITIETRRTGVDGTIDVVPDGDGSTPIGATIVIERIA